MVLVELRCGYGTLLERDFTAHAPSQSSSISLQREVITNIYKHEHVNNQNIHQYVYSWSLEVLRPSTVNKSKKSMG